LAVRWILAFSFDHWLEHLHFLLFGCRESHALLGGRCLFTLHDGVLGYLILHWKIVILLLGRPCSLLEDVYIRLSLWLFLLNVPLAARDWGTGLRGLLLPPDLLEHLANGLQLRLFISLYSAWVIWQVCHLLDKRGPRRCVHQLIRILAEIDIRLIADNWLLLLLNDFLTLFPGGLRLSRNGLRGLFGRIASHSLVGDIPVALL
jgi:hypothetical protein